MTYAFYYLLSFYSFYPINETDSSVSRRFKINNKKDSVETKKERKVSIPRQNHMPHSYHYNTNLHAFTMSQNDNKNIIFFEINK